MFGNFNLNAGLSQLHDLGGKFQKIREDLEQNIESSLRSGITPGRDSGVAGVSASADGSVSFAGMIACATTVLRSSLYLLALLASATVFWAIRVICDCAVQIRGRGTASLTRPQPSATNMRYQGLRLAPGF